MSEDRSPVHIVSMTTPSVSPDISAITDRVMERQLTPVDRSTAEALVRMVLECAQEVVDARSDIVRGRILSISGNSKHPKHHSVMFDTGSERLHLLGPDLTAPGGRELVSYLQTLGRQQVALQLTIDPIIGEDRPVIVRVHGVGSIN